MSEEIRDKVDFNGMLTVMLMIVAVMFLASGYAWLLLPDDIQVPLHWGIDGQPDRWGDKTEGLLVMPVIALVTVVMFRLVPVIEPRKRNLLQSSNAYVVVGTTVVAFMAALHLLMLGNLMELIVIGIGSAVPFLVAVRP